MKGRKKKVYLEDVADRSLRLIDGTLDDLERLRSAETRKRRLGGEVEIDFASLNALDKTTRALSGLLAQLRQIAKDNRERMGNIGPTERLQLVMDWFAALPEEQMYSHLLDFKAIYDQRRRRHDDEEADRQERRLSPAPALRAR